MSRSREPSKARLDIAEWRINNGCDIHEGGDASLMRASLDGSRTLMMELLVRHGADVNAAWHGVYPVVFAPCETLDPIALDWLLQHGPDPNCGEVSEWQSKGRSLLHVGAEFDQVEIAKQLLEAGANIDARAATDPHGMGGQTPIFHAATQGHDFGIE
jgi:ankyrin repeat protein